MILFRLLPTAEAEEGLAARFGPGKSAPEILFNSEFEMRRHFHIEIAILHCATEERPNAVKQSTKLVGHLVSLPSESASTRPITSESRCQ